MIEISEKNLKISLFETSLVVWKTTTKFLSKPGTFKEWWTTKNKNWGKVMVEEIWLEIVVSNVSDSKTAWYEIKG